MRNIIYIGDFVAKYSTERYIAEAFEELGYKVTRIQDTNISFDHVETIVNEIADYDPVLVLFSKNRPKGRTEEVIEELKKRGIKTACWLFDLYFGLSKIRESRLRERQAPYNAETLFSTDGGHDEDFKRLGINHKLLRQGIYEKEAILYKRPLSNDVIFVGGDYFSTRTMLLRGLENRYGDGFKRYGGVGYPTVRNLPLNELYASTKVVVGDSQPSPRYWSNRIYETLGRGGFLIHPYVEGLEDEFEIGKHLVTFPYGNYKELHRLVDYYLVHDKEREAIRKAGFEHVKKNYTYKKRCEQLLTMI